MSESQGSFDSPTLLTHRWRATQSLERTIEKPCSYWTFADVEWWALRWALRDSNPRPAECKWERFSREGSSMVAFVDIH